MWGGAVVSAASRVSLLPSLHHHPAHSCFKACPFVMLRTSLAAVARAAPRHVRGIARVAPIAVSHATSTGSRAAGTIKTDQGLELKTDLQKEVRTAHKEDGPSHVHALVSTHSTALTGTIK